jgi:nucleotide-binding universal stress UspA family protein
MAISTSTEPTLPIDPRSDRSRGEREPIGSKTPTMLGKIIDEVAADFPSVEIRQHVVAGNAAQELIKWSEHADRGRRGEGHGGFTGMLMGSVSRHVLAHSACTVVTVR